MTRQEKRLELLPGETIFIEGKYGLIAVHVFSHKTVVTCDERTDAKQA